MPPLGLISDVDKASAGLSSKCGGRGSPGAPEPSRGPGTVCVRVYVCVHVNTCVYVSSTFLHTLPQMLKSLPRPLALLHQATLDLLVHCPPALQGHSSMQAGHLPCYCVSLESSLVPGTKEAFSK